MGALSNTLFKLRYPREASLMRQLIREGFTFCSFEKLALLARLMHRVRNSGESGLIIEAGCALGGSAILLSLIKEPERPLYLYDVFEKIPPPSPRDGAKAHQRYEVIASGKAAGPGGQTYYGYVPDLQNKVIGNFSKFGVEVKQNNIRLHKGLFENTMTVRDPVSLAHIDCDWYDSVKTCIERITPHLQAGGYLVFDDYKSYDGCRQAVDELLSTRQYEVLSLKYSAVLKKLA